MTETPTDRSAIDRGADRRPGPDRAGPDRTAREGSPGPGPGPGPSPRRALAADLLDAFGPLAPLLGSPEVTDVFVNGPGRAWVDRGFGATPDPAIRIGDEQALRALATRLVSFGGRHIDEATPCVDVVVGPGIRVHAVLPPVSPTGTLLSIRLPAVTRLTLSDLDARGMFPPGVLDALATAVRERVNLLVTGAGGSGKTTLLSALLASAAAAERIVAVEDVSELRVAHPQFVALEARQSNLEGAGSIGLEQLVREALRMRPDRLVLGECRGAEVRELLAALNTGHDGGAGTLHANALDDVPTRMEALGALGGLSPEAVARQAVSAIGLVVHLARRSGERRVVGLGRFTLDARDRLGVAPLDSPVDPPVDRGS
ncbi:TadA family conjugal transfer-associated ATPase [Microbacteriaceae bacterium 4G12]